MLTPEYLRMITEGSEQIASDLQVYLISQIIERIMARLGRGADYLMTATDRYNIKLLQELGLSLDDINNMITKYTDLEAEEIRQAYQDAGIEAMAYDDAIYQLAGMSPTAFMLNPRMLAIMQRNYNVTMGQWDNFTKTLANNTQQKVLQVLNEAHMKTVSGATSYIQAYKEAIDEFATNGIHVIEYPSGHKDTIETATLRAVRTGVSQSTAQMQLEHMKEEGINLVLTSQHMGARPTHEEWQGKVFYIDWETFDPYAQRDRKDPVPVPSYIHQKYPEFVSSTGYGYVDGLCGANCRHHFTVYMEGITTIPEPINKAENDRIYQLTQRQRELERRIRADKQKKATWDSARKNTTDPEAKALAEDRYTHYNEMLQKHNKEYREFCEANNLRPLNERLMIAKADRKGTNSKKYSIEKYGRKVEENKANISAEDPKIGEKVFFNENATYEVKIEGKSEAFNKSLSDTAKEIAKLGSENHYEYQRLINLKDGTFSEIKTDHSFGSVAVDYKYADAYPNEEFAFVHNHNTASPFSAPDTQILIGEDNIKSIVAVRNDGIIYYAESNGKSSTDYVYSMYEKEIREMEKQGVKSTQIELGLTKLVLRDYSIGGAKKYET